jgi:hypothetical protein
VGDYLELRYGSQDADPGGWIGVARIGPPSGRAFPVRWLIEQGDAANREMVEAIRKELDFILLEVGGPDPWSYAQYHCQTTSNRYGFVHWTNYVSNELVAKHRSQKP